MEWYAIQIRTCKDKTVATALADHGIELLWPRRPFFFTRKGIIRLQYKPLIPGYLFAKMEIADFYKEKRNTRIDGMMIRICGNWYDAVSLSKKDLTFFRLFLSKTKPVLLTKDSPKSQTYQVFNPPPWCDDVELDWYDQHQLEAKLRLKTQNERKYHSFKIAAVCLMDMSKTCFERNKKLLTDCYG